MSHLASSTSIGNHGGRLGRRRFLATLALAGASFVAACASGGAAQQSTGSDNATVVARVSGGMNSLAAAAQSANVAVVKVTGQNTFDPSTITVPVGSTVSWLNDATTPQSATFDPSFAATKGDIVLPAGATPFDSGMIQPGQSWSHSFTTAGTYKYACVPNEAAGMKGTVIVT
jgi:plastocyanin